MIPGKLYRTAKRHRNKKWDTIKQSHLQAELHSALKRAQGATSKHIRRQLVPNTHSNRKKRQIILFSSAPQDHQSKLSQSSWTYSITRCNRMTQILMQRVVRSVINLIEQAQDTNLPFVPQTTKFILTQTIPTANNTIKQALTRLCRYSYGGVILQVEQNIHIETPLEHTRTIK